MSVDIVMPVQSLCAGCIHKGNIENRDVCRRNPPTCIPMMKQSNLKGGPPDLVIFGMFPPCPPDGHGCGEWNDEQEQEE